MNVALVRRGAASVWFFQGDQGRYARRLLAAARSARSDRRGLWGACPGTRLDPYAAVETSRARPARPTPDLDCAQVGGPVAGVGCE